MTEQLALAVDARSSIPTRARPKVTRGPCGECRRYHRRRDAFCNRAELCDRCPRRVSAGAVSMVSKAPRRTERGRRTTFGPFPVEHAYERLGSPRDVLRAHGVQVWGRMARCPLHEDRSPSLSLYRGGHGREKWKCHGCGRGGDAIDLEAALSGRSVRELIRG
jgi:CHC2 zinc finger